MKSSGKENYYIKEGNNYTLLKYKWYLTEQKGIQLKKENLTYKRQLASYLGDCLYMMPSLEDAQYNSNSLESIFLKYYECTDRLPTFRKVREKIVADLGILTGVASTSISINSRQVFDILRINFPSDYSLVAGIFVDLILPRKERNGLFIMSYFTLIIM